VVFHGDAAPLGELRLELREVESVRPIVLRRRPQHLKYLEDLINFTVTGKKWPALNHFGKNAAGRPQVHSERVSLLAEQDLRAAVPERDHLVSVGLYREAERSCQPEVRQLHFGASRIDQQILWLQISVEDSVLVAVDQSMQDLEGKALRFVLGQWLVATRSHELFQVKLKVFENEPQLVTRVNNFFQSDSINHEK
jgi:hypothetical protein